MSTGELHELVYAPHRVPITLATLVGHLSFYLVLLLALRHVGGSDAEVSWVQVLAWFAFARLLTAVPFTLLGWGWWRRP